MYIFEQIWKDIRSGENIDLYLTIVLAFAIAFLSLIGVNVTPFVAPLTLTTLGLVAISSLVNRRRLEDIHRDHTRTSTEIFSNEFSPELKLHFDSGRQFWLIGVTLNRTIKNHYIKLEEKLRQGYHVRILVVQPSGTSIAIAASRHYALASRDANTKAAESLASLQLFCGLKNSWPNSLEIRTIDNPLSFGAICIDPDLATGALYLEHYPYRTASDSVPKFILRANDGYWYEFFKSEVIAMWNGGVEWNCSSTSE